MIGMATVEKVEASWSAHPPGFVTCLALWSEEWSYGLQVPSVPGTADNSEPGRLGLVRAQVQAGTRRDILFGAFCLAARTLTFCQLMGLPLKVKLLAGEQKATEYCGWTKSCTTSESLEG